MTTNYMNFAYLMHSERETTSEFKAHNPTVEALMPEFLNTLFRLSYFARQQESTTEDGFQFFVFERYVQLPYTVRSIWLLARLGYYVEGAVVVRHLLETFVQLRYFARHRDLLVGHANSPATKKGRVHFKTMFEELAPGYYARHYSLLANLSHAGMAMSALIGMDAAVDEHGRQLTPIGCKFSANGSSFVMNQLLMILSGYVRQVPNWFSAYAGLVDSETEEQRKLNLAALHEWREGHRTNFPASHGWHQLSEMLMGHSAP